MSGKISQMPAVSNLPASAYVPIVDPTEAIPEDRNKRWMGLQAALAAKSDTSHAHAIADVTGLQTALDGKAATSHTHTIANVTDLQTALDGKAAE